nr:MAG TPA_asm: hypothetical protein [Bacteriophage sp.]
MRTRVAKLSALPSEIVGLTMLQDVEMPNFIVPRLMVVDYSLFLIVY